MRVSSNSKSVVRERYESLRGFVSPVGVVLRVICAGAACAATRTAVTVTG
jgi:hypothetical protein